MAFEPRENTFVLFRNRHRSNPKSPTMTGNANNVINGVKYELEIAGWTRESEKAGKFLSGTIRLADGDGKDDGADAKVGPEPF